MPAKKAASRSSDMLWKWVYTVGAVVAALAAAFGFQNMYLTWVLILAGILVGWFFFDPEELEHFGLRYLVLFAVQAVLSAVPTVGSFITAFFGGLVMFLGPVVLTMAAHFFWNKRIATLF